MSKIEYTIIYIYIYREVKWICVWPVANGSGDFGLEHVGEITVGGE